MIDIWRTHRNHNEAGALHSMIAPKLFIDPMVALTDAGDLIAMLRARGRESECAMPGDLNHVCRRMEAALRGLDERFRVYQYVIKTKCSDIPVEPSGNPVVDQITEDRNGHLQKEAGGLFSLELYWAICLEGALPRRGSRRGFPAFLDGFSLARTLVADEAELHRARDLLLDKARGFLEQLQDVAPFEMMHAPDVLQLLRRLLNYNPEKLGPLSPGNLADIDFRICDSELECHSDRLKLDNDNVRVLTLKEPPSYTSPDLLHKIQEIPANLIVCVEWKPVPSWDMRKLIKSAERHHFNQRTSLAGAATGGSANGADRLVDSSSVAHVSDLGESLKEMEVHGKRFGLWSLTVVAYDRDASRLARAVSSCSKVFSTVGAQLHEERYNLVNAFLSVVPGNHAFNRRYLYLLDTNCADLAFVFAPDAGSRKNAHLNAEYLAILETPQRTPYFLNLHYQDVGHSFLSGATGAGKSFCLNFILAMLQKYWPLTYIFDIGGRYRKLTETFGGVHVRVGIDQGFSINPFSLPKTKENLQFLFSFVKVLITSSGYTPTMDDDQDLWTQIESIYDIPTSHRRLSTLASVLRRPLAQALTKWIGDGQYGRLFDNLEDNLTFATFQAFDFEGMEKYPDMLEPLLFYVLHRASEAINQPEMASTLKVFALDEAWRFFRNPAIKAYIVQALKTWRKRNALMILATQSSEDLLRSEMLDVVVESCPTKFFLANPGMDRTAVARLFHLSEAETERIAALIPKKQMLLIRPGVSKVLELNVDPRTYALLASHAAAPNGRV